MQILDGKKVSEDLKAQIKIEVEAFQKHYQKTPHLAVIIVGNNPASETYVGAKVKGCAETGMNSTLIKLEDTITEEALLSQIETLNQDADIDGILVQLPLPKHISEDKVIATILPEKDVDGFHPINQGKMILGQEALLPATPYGILLMMRYYNIDTAGKHVVVIGRSNIVGKPMSVLLCQNSQPGNATVTICHSKTKDLPSITRQADILIAAIGVPRFVKPDMVKPGAVIIDVGINKIADASRKSGSRLVGDVDYDQLETIVSAMTPVPKGVGPMTICGLLKNTLTAAQRRADQNNA